MYFCKKCSYLLDISRSSIKVQDERKVIDKIPDALKLIEDNKDLSLYKANFQKNELSKNKRYQKLSDENKNKLNQLFNDVISSGAEFKCENCNYIKPITETMLLYQIGSENKLIKVKSFEQNKLMTKDPLLPHTKDYICKNSECATHKDDKLKDSVFYKDKNSYKINYICGLCYYNW
jgi:hypothetical protein